MPALSLDIRKASTLGLIHPPEEDLRDGLPLQLLRSDENNQLISPWAQILDQLQNHSNTAIQKLGRGLHGLQAIQEMRKIVRKIDLIISAGSGTVFDDWNGPWNHPWNYLKWALISRSVGTKFAPLCVGAGPINTGLGRFFLHAALRLSDYRSFRDPSSVQLVESVGLSHGNPIFPDLAFSLSETDIQQRRSRVQPITKESVIGISTVASHDPSYKPGADPRKYETYVDRMADFCEWLLANGHILILLRSQVDADERVAADLKARLRGRVSCLDDYVLVPPTSTYHDLLDQIWQCDLVVGGRFHCHVLPFVCGKPVLGIAYHPKTTDLMDYMGQSSYCLDIERLAVPDMKMKFNLLARNASRERAVIEQRAAMCRAALDNQYDMLVGDRALRHESCSCLPQ